jgi:hypothetical protein
MTFRPLQSLVRRPLWTASLTAVCTAALVTAGCGGGGGDGTDGTAPTPTTIIEANIDTLAAQIGGGTQDVELYTTVPPTGRSTPWPTALRPRPSA